MSVIAGKARPRGAYPHFRRAGDFLFVSGIGARQPDNTIAGAKADSMGTVALDIREQTRATLQNVADVLAAAGASMADVVEISVYLVNINDFGGYNEEYARWFTSDTGPARTTVAVHQLPNPQMLIEVKAVAYKPLAAKA